MRARMLPAPRCPSVQMLAALLLLPLLAASQTQQPPHTVRLHVASLDQLAVPAPAAVLSALGVRRGDVPVAFRLTSVEYDTVRSVLLVDGFVSHADAGTALAGMRIIAARYDSTFSPALSPSAVTLSDEDGHFRLQWPATVDDVLCITLLGHLEAFIPIGRTLPAQRPVARPSR